MRGVCLVGGAGEKATILGSGIPLVLGLRSQVYNKGSEQQQDKSYEVDQVRLSDKSRVFFHGEECLLSESSERSCNGQDERQQTHERVDRHDGSTQVLGKTWVQERSESEHPLQYIDEDGDDAQPTVQGVEVGDGGGSQVVRVEHRDAGNHRQHDDDKVDGRMDQLQSLLADRSQRSVHKDGVGEEVDHADGIEERVPVELQSGVGPPGEPSPRSTRPDGHQHHPHQADSLSDEKQ